MFSKIIVAFVASLAVFVAAAPTQGNDINNSCNTDDMYCCNQTYEGDSNEAKALQNVLHFDIPINTKIGTTCTPISVLSGLGTGGSCNQQSVCCTGNNFSGAVVVGCSPININL